MTPEQAGRPTSPVWRLAKPVHSRWHAGPTSFGLWGRVLTTLVVLLMFPWTQAPILMFLYLPPYLLIAALVLRAVWRKDVVYLPADGTEQGLLEPRVASLVRAGAGAVGGFLTLAAIGSAAANPAPFLPAIPFVLAAISGRAAEEVGRGILALQERPAIALVVLNVLNVVDTLATDAAIRAGHAAELNPFVARFGTPAKVAIVGVCSLLLLKWRPRALVWPMLVFVALTAYHMGGYLLTV